MTDAPQTEQPLAIPLEPEERHLSRTEFQGLSDMPPELEWFANLDNPRTRPSLPPRRERIRGLATIRRKMGHFSRDNARSRQIRLRAVLARIPDSSCIMQALLPYSRAV
jgi:hypothetical protein